MTPLALTHAQLEEAALLYVHHGWPCSEIGEHFGGIDKGVVRDALRRIGITPESREEPPPLRMKQCPHCLHFRPIGLFAWNNAARTKRQAWCNDCTNHPADPKWTTNPAPLAEAMGNWRTN